MHPILFEIRGFEIYTYGPLMALGFLLAFFLVYHISRLKGEDPEFYMDLYIWGIVTGLLGAKLLYNLIEYKDFLEDPIKMMNCRNGGLVWYGGVILGTAFTVWYSRRKGMPFLQVLDTLAAPLALGLAVGRWGCLMGGCCYGAPAELPWAIRYPLEHITAGVPVHPAPLYESLVSILIAVAIYGAIRLDVRRGVPALMYFTLYGIARILIETCRGDKIRGFVYESEVLSISTSQFIGVLMLIAAAVAWFALFKRPKRFTQLRPEVTAEERPAGDREEKGKSPEKGLKKSKGADKGGKKGKASKKDSAGKKKSGK